MKYRKYEMSAQKWATIEPQLEDIFGSMIVMEGRCVKSEYDENGDYVGCLKNKEVEIDIVWRDENDPLIDIVKDDEVWPDPNGDETMHYISGWEEQYRLDYQDYTNEP